MNIDNILYPNERVLCSIGGKNKLLTYTSVRLIFFENDYFYSLTLDNVVSIHYKKVEKTFYRNLGFIFLFFVIIAHFQATDANYFGEFRTLLFLISICLILYYLLTRKSLFVITTKSSEKISHEVSGTDPSRIRQFCN